MSGLLFLIMTFGKPPVVWKALVAFFGEISLLAKSYGEWS